MPSPTRWGFMGAGKIAHDFASAMKSLPKGEHEIVAVAASNGKRAQEFATKFGIKHAFEGYEKVAECPEVDIVYINPLNPTHLKCVQLALKAGKHTLCEKPLGMNSKQVKEMIELARQKGVFFMEAFWSRFFPIYDEIRSALNDGRIGEPKFFQGNFGNCVPKEELARIFKKGLGGSSVADFGCYLVQLSTLVFGGQRPEKVIAIGKLNGEGVDVMDCVTLKYKNDAVAQLMISAEVNMAHRVQVFGTKGYFELPTSLNSPAKVIINGKPIEHPLPESNEKFNYPNSQGLAYEIAHVRECLLKGLKESPLQTWADSEVIVSILDEVRHQVGVVYAEDKE